jgi:hypothetical protein
MRRPLHSSGSEPSLGELTSKTIGTAASIPDETQSVALVGRSIRAIRLAAVTAGYKCWGLPQNVAAKVSAPRQTPPQRFEGDPARISAGPGPSLFRTRSSGPRVISTPSSGRLAVP